jgi:hypothetical protein
MNVLFIICKKVEVPHCNKFREVESFLYAATIILSLVLYGCETWSLMLREERRLRVFEKRMLRRLFGGKRDEVIGEWRRLHNEEVHALYFSPNISRVIR